MSTIRERLNAIYTPLDEAVALLHVRRASLESSFVVRPLGRSEEMQNTRPKGRTTNDESPQSRPEDELEKKLAERACGYLPRNSATPNYELTRFVSLTTSVGLTPLVGEFTRDKFVHGNPDKYALAHLTFHDGIGRNGGARNQRLRIVNVEEWHGQQLREVHTFWNQPLLEFHHELLTRSDIADRIKLADSSSWFFTHGPTAREYYADFLALFVDRAVLFETFLLTPHDAPFTTDIVLPAFETACARIGKRPLICRLDPPDMEGDPYWLQYPITLMPFVKEKLKAAEC